MSDDLVKRLRSRVKNYEDGWREGDMLAEEAAARIEKLEAALRGLIVACDKGRINTKTGMSGMTTTVNIKSSWINNVEAWAVEDARQALEGKND